jgi:UDP-N-acetylmuramate--alanine ligase
VHQAVRELYPGQKIMAIFQPHLFSRTRDFMDGFAAELSNFDEVLLLPIYPARELPMPGIVSEVVLDKMTQANAKMAEKGTLISSILDSEATVFVTIGAGDIGEEVGKIKAALLATIK